MTISIQFLKMSTSETMSEYVTKLLKKLDTKYNWIIKADVYFKVVNDPTGKKQVCEIELSAPGPRMFATSQEKNYELAVKNTIADLIRQLKKRKATFKPY